MKAIVYRRYGAPDVLRLEEIAKPIPAGNEVLIQIRAAAVNPYDWHFLRGTPHLIRLMSGLRRPKSPRLGADVAGIVDLVGRNVTHFQKGDPVFGTCKGSFAEFACATEKTLAPKPDNITFEQAASAGIAGLTALQGLRDKGRLQPGQKVLINGAAGGVGTFAVQIAKALGAEVTGVCSGRNVEMVRSIGADHVVDYTLEDFTESSRRYDLVFDCIGNHSLRACLRILNSKGAHVAVGGPSDAWSILSGTIQKPLLSLFVSQRLVGFIAHISREDLEFLVELMKAEKLLPVIDRRYPLDQVPEAIRYLEEGHARGKVIIALNAESEA
jgi:NADPH:quinone reductase-like Zn-dependent oxidoreductase